MTSTSGLAGSTRKGDDGVDAEELDVGPDEPRGQPLLAADLLPDVWRDFAPSHRLAARVKQRRHEQPPCGVGRDLFL